MRKWECNECLIGMESGLNMEELWICLKMCVVWNVFIFSHGSKRDGFGEIFLFIMSSFDFLTDDELIVFDLLC